MTKKNRTVSRRTPIYRNSRVQNARTRNGIGKRVIVGVCTVLVSVAAYVSLAVYTNTLQLRMEGMKQAIREVEAERNENELAVAELLAQDYSSVVSEFHLVPANDIEYLTVRGGGMARR